MRRISPLDRYVMVQNAAVNGIWFPTVSVNLMSEIKGHELHLSWGRNTAKFSWVVFCLSLKKQLTSLLTSVSWSQTTPGLTWQRQQPREWTASNRSTSLTTSSRWAPPRAPCLPHSPSPLQGTAALPLMGLLCQELWPQSACAEGLDLWPPICALTWLALLLAVGSVAG